MKDFDLIIENALNNIKEDVYKPDTYDTRRLKSINSKIDPKQPTSLSEQPSKAAAEKLIEAITTLFRTVKRFNEKSGNLKPQNPAGYKAALANVKTAIENAENDEWFIPIKDQKAWNFLKKEVETGMFPQTDEDEKAALKFYVDINGKIRQSNNLKTNLIKPSDIAKDLGGVDKSKVKSLRPVAKRSFEGTNISKLPDDDKVLKDLANEKGAKADALEKREKDLRAGIASNNEQGVQKVNKVITQEARQSKYGKEANAANNARVSAANVLRFKESPVEGCDSLAKLMNKWKSSGVEQKGQIKIIATDASGLGSGAGAPVMQIDGKLYTCGRKFLLQKQFGGYFTKGSEYYGYFTDSRKDPAFDAIRKKLNGDDTVEEACVEKVKNMFNY